jgi:hypothetical protein
MLASRSSGGTSPALSSGVAAALTLRTSLGGSVMILIKLPISLPFVVSESGGEKSFACNGAAAPPIPTPIRGRPPWVRSSRTPASAGAHQPAMIALIPTVEALI